MKVHSLWLTGVALAALIVPVSAASAAASGSSTAVMLDQANQRIGELDQRVDALEAELQASEQRQAADRSAMAAPPTVTGGWWDNTTISGRMYWDFSYVENKTNTGGGGAFVKSGTLNGTSFDIKRFYLGVDHKFNDVYSANLTTDFTYDSTTGVNQIYIKKAYLQAKVNDALVFKVGSTDMPWIPFMEDIYGFRYVENTLTDRLKDGNSADWGAHVSGKLYDGMLNYAVSVVNGAGYKKANIFRTNGPDVEARVNLNLGDFILGVGGYDGKFGKQFGSALHHSFSRGDAVAAYVAKDFRVGVEGFVGENVSSVSSVTGDRESGVGGFASWTFMPEWTVFGRYDWSTKRVAAGPAMPNNYYNAGIEWNPIKIVDFSLVYKHEDENGNYATSNLAAGAAPPAPGAKTRYDEIGIFGQVRW
jgi:hypothetical protein